MAYGGRSGSDESPMIGVDWRSEAGFLMTSIFSMTETSQVRVAMYTVHSTYARSNEHELRSTATDTEYVLRSK